MKRITRIILSAIAVLLLLLVAAVAVFTRTDFGRERARRTTLGLLADMVHGKVIIGRIEGNLASRFSLVDVAIEDPDGRLFLTADRVTARIATTSLFSRRIAFTEISLHRPVVRFARGRDGVWNFERIFPRDTTTTVKDTIAGFGDWVELRNVTLADGRFVIDQPWTPDEGLPDLVRDSAMGSTHDDNGGAWVERVPPGYQRSADLRAIYASVPHALIADPDSSAITLRVASLRTVASLLRPPPLDIRDFRGDVRIDDETITAKDMAASLPTSRLRGSVTYRVAQREIQLGVVADTIAFDDVRALYGKLPEGSGGRLELDAAIRDTAPDEYVIRNARLHAGGSLAEGHATFVVGPTTSSLRDTDVHLTRFSMSLLERLAEVEVPVPGAFSGRVQASGPIERMQVALDGDFDPERHPPLHLTVRGGLGFAADMRADRLEVSAEHVPATLLRDQVPGFPLGGMFTLHTTVTGSTGTTLAGPFNLTHADAGALSRFIGSVSIAPKNAMAMNLEFRLTPLSLELVQRFMPKPDLRGEVTGTGRLRGTPRALEAHLALQLPAGTVGIDGAFDRTRPTATYNADVRLDSVDLKLVAPSLPRTQLNGVATIRGRGTTIPTLDARVTANLRDFVFDSTRFLEAIVHADARASRLEVDTLRVRTDFGVVRANGSFGLAEGSAGTLTYRIDLNDLAGLQRWISAGDTGLVHARPLIRQRLGAVALRADSIRRLQAGDTVNLAALVARGDLTLRGQPRPEMPEVPPVRRDSLAGSARITGDLRGNVKRFDVRGSAATSGVVYDGSEVGRGRVDFTVAGAGAPNAAFTAEAGLDSVRFSGFAFDSTHVKGTYRGGAGEVDLRIFPGDTAEYHATANYVLHTDHGEVHLRDLSLRFDSTTWVSSRPSTVRWRGRGLEIDSLQLRERVGAGRIFVHGEIPDRDAGRLDIGLDSVRLAPWLTLLQSDIPANAVANFHGRLERTRIAPRFEGTLALVAPTYRGVPYPEVHARLSYDQRRLVVDGDLRRAIGTPLATIKGTLPIDLSLGDSVATRMLDGPLQLDVSGDSIPLGPLREVTDALSVVDGYAKGAIGLRGTYKRPRLEGALDMRFVGLGLEATGIVFRNVATHVRATGESFVIDSLVAHSGGTVRARGTVTLTNLTEPVFDLRVESSRARILGNERGELWADSRLTVKGPLDTLTIDGSVGITRGVVNLPDPQSLKLISTGDPAVLAVIDTAMARELDVLPGRNVLENLNPRVDLHVARGMWARSREANIEIYGDLRVRRDPLTGLPAFTGALFTDHGEYTLYGRDFVVTRGSARFTGDPSINPAVQILAKHEVRQAGRAPFDIQVTVGGTMRQPTLSLESEAQPTLSQTDLLSFLAFGQSSSALLQFQGSALDAGGQAGSSMAGNVASLATLQLASVAMGALMDQVKSDLTEITRADVVRIRSSNLPADLSLGGVATVLKGTELRIGKYVGPQTFIYGTIRGSGTIPGLSVERWYGSGSKLKFVGTFETRFQPLKPSFATGAQPEAVRVLGALVRWTIGW